MSEQDVAQYWFENKYAAMMIFKATSDYTAARCCILNALFSGFMLASQAIEKLLKAMIYLESHREMKSCHDPFSLKEQLKSLRDYDLDKYDFILKKLYDHYQSRYHDNKTTGAGASSTELPDIDALWLELIHKLPVPDEAKYRIAFFDFLFDPNPYWNNDYWLKAANSAIESKLPSMAVKYQEIQKHLYPA
ncbi:MAG TPA: hypothetical protein VFK06_12605 [Candidatus Angelobacter sp.]|nr:hypothetical protein [Candidatus Angelobacter sp.]